MAEPLTLHGELLVPAPLMHHCQPADVERVLHDVGLLPLEAQERRWRVDAERPGYVLTFTVTLTLLP